LNVLQILKFKSCKAIIVVFRYAAFGLGLALDMIPISTCDSDEAPDLYSLGQPRGDTSGPPVQPSDPTGQPSNPVEQPGQGCALLQASPTREGKRRMAELVQELVDQGLI
jgi:hypothetical protein